MTRFDLSCVVLPLSGCAKNVEKAAAADNAAWPPEAEAIEKL